MRAICSLVLLVFVLSLIMPQTLAAGSLEDMRRDLETGAIAGTADKAGQSSDLQQSLARLNALIERIASQSTEMKFSPEQQQLFNQSLQQAVTQLEEFEKKFMGQTSSTSTDSGSAATGTAAPPATGAPETQPPATSARGTVNVNTRLNVRDSPWGEITGKLQDGDAVEIIGQQGDWLQVRTDGGGTSFVHSRYVNQEGQTDTSFEGTVRTNGDTLNVRSSPGGPIIGSLNPEAAVRVTGRDGDWYRVDFNGQTAYVSKNFVSQEGDRFPTVPGSDPPRPPGADGGSTAGGAPESGPAVNGFTFPVGARGCRFSDTWGAPRSGGRRHEGQDIFNSRGTPLVACKTGTIGRMDTTGLGGTSIRVLADGVSWYYTHLDRFANTRPGQSIQAGGLVGYLGNTGNARSTPPHLHFGAYRGGRAFNPYSLLNASYPREWGGH